MGRPRRHLEPTARALLAAAEQIVDAEGLGGLTIRRVADAVGTTTRAVYSTFGSKDALVAALGRRAFELLQDELGALRPGDDPADDLVVAGLVFRRFALAHPSLFAIGIQRSDVDPRVWPEVRGASRDAFGELERRLERLGQLRGLGGRSPSDAGRQFHALCEGLASMELRAALPIGREEREWREALTAFVRGLSSA